MKIVYGRHDVGEDINEVHPGDPDYYLRCDWNDEKADWVWSLFGLGIDEIEDRRGEVFASRFVYSFIAQGDREWAKRIANHYKIPMPEPEEEE